MDALLPVAAQTGVFGIAFMVVFWLFRTHVRFLERQIEMWQQMANRGAGVAERGAEVTEQLAEPLRRKVITDDRLDRLESLVERAVEKLGRDV